MKNEAKLRFMFAEQLSDSLVKIIRKIFEYVNSRKKSLPKS